MCLLGPQGLRAFCSLCVEGGSSPSHPFSLLRLAALPIHPLDQLLASGIWGRCLVTLGNRVLIGKGYCAGLPVRVQVAVWSPWDPSRPLWLCNPRTPAAASTRAGLASWAVLHSPQEKSPGSQWTGAHSRHLMNASRNLVWHPDVVILHTYFLIHLVDKQRPRKPMCGPNQRCQKPG